jgi:chitodextrinase
VASGSITQTSATITWTTDEQADSQVKYGLTSSYGSTTTLDTGKVTSHSVTISGLTAGTTYHYQVVSKDASGNAGSSTDKSFTTDAPSGDTTNPTTSMTAPSAGATVSGTVTVSASASDNVGVVGVQFKLDGANLGSEDTGSPYSVSWNTTGVSNGSHTLTAVARDAAGNTKTASSVTVTVNNQSSIPADINQDGHVDYLDLSILATNYNKSGAAITTSRADMNNDSTVNYLDLSILATNYGT